MTMLLSEEFLGNQVYSSLYFYVVKIFALGVQILSRTIWMRPSMELL